MATEVLNREELISAIWQSKGKVGVISERMGVSAQTIYNYADRYATVKNALDEARLQFDEIMVDVAEGSLFKSVKEGESWAVKYALGTKGKNRGYVERQEHTGEGGGPIALNIDFSELTNIQLSRIANGENPADVIGNN